MRALTACAVAAVTVQPLEAAACGCFATPTTVNDPAVQAGERIAFASDGNHVTAYVQIKFQGAAQDFGWLVPVPAVPEVKVGTDELFEVLDETTRPVFQLSTTLNASCRPSPPLFGCAAGAPEALAVGQGDGSAPVGASPLVLRDTAGPYEYAVLKADSKAELTGWLNDNRYFVPVTSDAALAPYIRPGAFFLALKLRPGQTTGDLKPIVFGYTSDYPMIPLVLTSATAVPNMGIEVFVLASARAIPRNYHHVWVNPLKLDWATAQNYPSLVTAAVAEAPKKHAFVTEYAGSADVAAGQLVAQDRFGQRSALASSADAPSFVAYLSQYGFAARGSASPQELPDALLTILEAQIPYPQGLAAAGITRQQFFQGLGFYLSGPTQAQHPDWYAGWTGVKYDAPTLAAAVWDGYVQPILDADALLNSHSYLTRLFTTLSPEDMTEDPVFGFNKTLPDVPALRTASRVTGCSGVPTTLDTGGYRVGDEAQLTQQRKDAMPAAATVELLSEEGPPTLVSHYALDPSLAAAMHSSAGCAAADGAIFAGLAALWLMVRGQTRPRKNR
jgi:hypothetical protein